MHPKLKAAPLPINSSCHSFDLSSLNKKYNAYPIKKLENPANKNNNLCPSGLSLYTPFLYP